MDKTEKMDSIYQLGQASKLKKMSEEDLESGNSSFRKTIDIKNLKLNINPVQYEPPQ